MITLQLPLAGTGIEERCNDYTAAACSWHMCITFYTQLNYYGNNTDTCKSFYSFPSQITIPRRNQSMYTGGCSSSALYTHVL